MIGRLQIEIGPDQKVITVIKIKNNGKARKSLLTGKPFNKIINQTNDAIDAEI
mgnify:CR=1 FL=1